MLRRHDEASRVASDLNRRDANREGDRRPAVQHRDDRHARPGILRCAQDDHPLAILSTGRSRRVLEASATAISHGIGVGMTLADARALCPTLVALDEDRAADGRSLEALGRWLTRFTPSVSVGWPLLKNEDDDAANDAPRPHVLLLDLTGCERFFGGIRRLIYTIYKALQAFDIPARLAIAPTAGAAWALCASGARSGTLVEPDHLEKTLRPLPIETLRLDAEMLDALRHLGLETIGQLLDLPRNALPSRFGPRLLKRLDQALGDAPEPLVFLSYEPPISAKLELDAAIDAQEMILDLVETLLRQVVDDLTKRGHGARHIDLVCKFDPISRRSPVVKPIHLTRPTRRFATLFNLARCACETLDGGMEGFIGFALHVRRHERIADEQGDLIPDERAIDEAAFEQLVERLHVRLGDAAVFRPMPVESYLPELAWKPSPASSPISSTTSSTVSTALLPERSRPACLLPTPREIHVISEPSDSSTGMPRQFSVDGQVHRLNVIIGPERISGEWWRGHHRVRDYYEVEDEQACRFWIFRVIRPVVDAHGKARWTVRWFLHGRY